MARAVRCQPVPEEAWFNPRSVITAFMVDIVSLEQVFMHVQFLSVSISFHQCSITLHSSMPMLHSLNNQQHC
jgi:hypothetical protein